MWNIICSIGFYISTFFDFLIACCEQNCPYLSTPNTLDSPQDPPRLLAWIGDFFSDGCGPAVTFTQISFSLGVKFDNYANL